MSLLMHNSKLAGQYVVAIKYSMVRNVHTTRCRLAGNDGGRVTSMEIVRVELLRCILMGDEEVMKFIGRL